MDIPYGWLLLALLVGWIFQLWFNSIHVNKFHKKYNQLRQQGTMSAIGMSGKYWHGRAFAILVCNNEGIITVSKYLSGLTVFSELKEYSELLNHHIKDITEESDFDKSKIKKKVWHAFIHAASFIQKNIKNNEESTDEDA